jgi:hypothetical protein
MFILWVSPGIIPLFEFSISWKGNVFPLFGVTFRPGGREFPSVQWFEAKRLMVGQHERRAMAMRGMDPIARIIHGFTSPGPWEYPASSFNAQPWNRCAYTYSPRPRRFCAPVIPIGKSEAKKGIFWGENRGHQLRTNTSCMTRFR